MRVGWFEETRMSSVCLQIYSNWNTEEGTELKLNVAGFSGTACNELLYDFRPFACSPLMF